MKLIQIFNNTNFLLNQFNTIMYIITTFYLYDLCIIWFWWMLGLCSCCANSFKCLRKSFIRALPHHKAVSRSVWTPVLWMCLQHFSAAALIDASGRGKQHVSVFLTAQWEPGALKDAPAGSFTLTDDLERTGQGHKHSLN